MGRVLLLLLLAPLAVGCGAQQESDLDAAAAALSDAGSSRVEIEVSAGKKQLFLARGAFDYERDVGGFKLTSYGNFAEEWGMPGVPVEWRLVGRNVYTGWLLAGKVRWQSQEAYEPTDPEELIVPFEGGPAPDKVLELLMKTSKRTQILGTDEIRGVKAKHYRLHVDEDALLREYGIENSLDNHATEPLVVEVWIDDDNLTRRLHFPTPPGEEPEEITYDFFDFGVTVDVEAPRAGELMGEGEFEKLVEQECRARVKAEKKRDDFCAILVAGGPGGEVETAPIETVPQP